MAAVPPPPVPQSGRIFLSGAAQDQPEVSRLSAALIRQGLPISTEPVGARELSACDLFMPVISAQSEAQPEGNFRAEWRQAALRGAGPDPHLPFLMPLVLGAVAPATAAVPEPFRTVPWILLPAVDEEAALAARLHEIVRRHEALQQRREGLLSAPVIVPTLESLGSPEPVAVPARWAKPFFLPIAVATLAAVAIAGWLIFRPRADATANLSATPASVSPSPALTTAGARVTPVPVAGPALDSMRVALAPFENSTGDAALDRVSRVLAAEITRSLARTAGFRIEPISAADPAVAFASALRAGAGLLLTGSCTRVEGDVRVRVQLTFVGANISAGVLGPVVLPAPEGGAPLMEFVERVTTGVNEASALLNDPPTRLSAAIYARPWARWPLTQQARALAALPRTDIGERIATARTLVLADPDLAGANIEFARALRDSGRADEAAFHYSEIFNARSDLSEFELSTVLYEQSVLSCNFTSAATAARELCALRPESPALDNLVNVLIALNRPHGALAELNRWLESMRPRIAPAVLNRRETQVGIIETLTFIRTGELGPAQIRLAAFKARAGPAGALAALQLESLLLARTGSRVDLQRLLSRVAELPAPGPLESVRTAFNLHGQLLHAGRPDEAAYFLAQAQQLWLALPLSALASADAILLETDVRLALNRPGDALAALGRATPPMVAAHELEFLGRRALALQDAGRTSEFSALLAQIESMGERGSRGLPLYWRARLAARADLKHSALELMRLAISRGLWLDDLSYFSACYGRCEPEFAALRDVPAYTELLRPRD